MPKPQDPKVLAQWMAARTTHGAYVNGSEKAEHYVWRAMIDRAGRDRYYENVRVCARWKSYENFIEDMGERPGPNYQLERTDNNGHYEPGNCKWATRSEQQSNKRSTKYLQRDDGITGTQTQWATRYGISIQLFRYHMEHNAMTYKGRAFWRVQRPS